MFEDAEKVLTEDSRVRRRYCGFGRWVATLPEEHQEEARALVANPDWNCRALARYFQGKGAKFNDQVLSRHRNERCCGQELTRDPS